MSGAMGVIPVSSLLMAKTFPSQSTSGPPLTIFGIDTISKGSRSILKFLNSLNFHQTKRMIAGLITPYVGGLMLSVSTRYQWMRGPARCLE